MPDEVASLVTAYRNGSTIQEVAKALKLHPQTVSVHLDRQGISKRKHGLSSQQVTQAARLYNGGASLAKVGARFGVDAETVRRTLRRAGVTVRPRTGFGK